MDLGDVRGSTGEDGNRLGRKTPFWICRTLYLLVTQDPNRCARLAPRLLPAELMNILFWFCSSGSHLLKKMDLYYTVPFASVVIVNLDIGADVTISLNQLC